MCVCGESLDINGGGTLGCGIYMSVVDAGEEAYHVQGLMLTACTLVHQLHHACNLGESLLHLV